MARRHDFRILLHEKPFAGVNGSGKHNNWSLGTNTGVSLLKPGNNPKTNLRFLTFFVNTLAACTVTQTWCARRLPASATTAWAPTKRLQRSCPSSARN